MRVADFCVYAGVRTCNDRPVDDSEIGLFEAVMDGLARAGQRVGALDASPEVKAAVVARIEAMARAARHDLTITSRKLERLLSDLDAGEIPVFDE